MVLPVKSTSSTSTRFSLVDIEQNLRHPYFRLLQSDTKIVPVHVGIENAKWKLNRLLLLDKCLQPTRDKHGRGAACR